MEAFYLCVMIVKGNGKELTNCFCCISDFITPIRIALCESYNNREENREKEE